jgi:hypothetical protein
MKIQAIVAALFAISAFAASAGQPDTNVGNNIEPPELLAMGPDPGGHTGATVTPESSKSGQPAVDSARQAASGGRTESSGPPASQPPAEEPRQSSKQ